SCPICCNLADRFGRLLRTRGFGLAPLQAEWVKKRLNLPDGRFDEMFVLTHDDRILGGENAVIYLAGQYWWSWPIHRIAELPGFHFLAQLTYRWIAERRYCIGG